MRFLARIEPLGRLLVKGSQVQILSSRRKSLGETSGLTGASFVGGNVAVLSRAEPCRAGGGRSVACAFNAGVAGVFDALLAVVPH